MTQDDFLSFHDDIYCELILTRTIRANNAAEWKLVAVCSPVKL